MTVEQFLLGHLTSSGMFESQATATLQLLKDEPNDRALAEVLGKSVDDYPTAFKAVAIMTVNRHAVRYIDRNCPQAWFRPMFG